MDSRFLPHNAHINDPENFQDIDPQLRQLKRQPYAHSPALLNDLPRNIPGIYTVGGGRQIGKTTLLKQWMALLLAEGVAPTAIAFFSGELIDDHHALLRLMQTQLTTMPDTHLRYLLLDEVTYIKDWDKAVKYAADAGLLEDVVLLLTGSDLALIQEARMRFPGRRGRSKQVDYHMYPLSFREVVQLKQAAPDLDQTIISGKKPSPDMLDRLYEEFQTYLLHGGYLTAINDLTALGHIGESTLSTYSDWIRGDMLKRGKQENYLREILGAIIKRYNSQITWNALARDLSIDHPKTVADYAALLSSMDALFIQPALLEDKLVAAPKKARKLMFTDPFIYHAIRAWLHPAQDPYNSQMLPATKDPQLCSGLVEACVATHYRRTYPTFYIKAEGEVDVAYINSEKFWPVEVKWTNQIRPKELKQIAKYSNGRILTKARKWGELNGVVTEPLPWGLVRVGVDL